MDDILLMVRVVSMGDGIVSEIKETRIIVLLSRYHGSNQQLLAIAKHLNHGEVLPVRCELRSRSKIFYSLYRLILWMLRSSILSGKLSNLLRCLVLKNSVVSCENDIILAKTPPFEFPLHLLAAGTGAQTYFVGKPKRIHRGEYDCLISTPSTKVNNATVELEMLPTSFTYEEYLSQRNVLEAGINTWCLLLGGDAKGFAYQREHWVFLADFIIEACKADDVHWVISTSPRTGSLAEQYFKERFINEPSFKGELYLWQEASPDRQRSVLSILSSATRIFVTEDSASMLSEAVNTRLPVVSLRPQASEYNSLTTPLAEYHTEYGHIIRLNIEDIAQKSLEINNWVSLEFRPIARCWSQTLNNSDTKSSLCSDV